MAKQWVGKFVVDGRVRYMGFYGDNKALARDHAEYVAYDEGDCVLVEVKLARNLVDAKMGRFVEFPDELTEV